MTYQFCLTHLINSCLALDKDDVCIVERLFSSSLVAIVSLSAPRKLKVCHFKVSLQSMKVMRNPADSDYLKGLSG